MRQDGGMGEGQLHEGMRGKRDIRKKVRLRERVLEWEGKRVHR